MRRRSTAIGLAVLLVASVVGSDPRSASAAEPEQATAAAYLAATRGGTAADYTLVYERSVRVAGTGQSLWAGKLVDASNGRIALVYVDTVSGEAGGPDLLAAREDATLGPRSAIERKASAGLRSAVAAAGSAGPATLPVAVWLQADTSDAVDAVAARHPEVTWLAGRPLSNDLGVIRRLRAELWEARRMTYAAAADAIRARVEELGGAVAYASTSAPLVFLDLPGAAVDELAAREDVISLGLEGAWAPSMATAGQAVDANWTGGNGDRGNGIRVAVVEYHNVRDSGDLNGKVVRSHSTTGHLAYTGGGQFDHPTWVAGAVAGQGGSYAGVAPGASIVSSGTGGYAPSVAYDRRIIAAADWAITPSGGDADIVNTSLVQDTSTGAEEGRRYFDSIVDEGGRIAVSAAGNYTNFGAWHVGSPGTGYNVLAVGGVDDRGSATRSDDRIWYVPGSNGSNWLDRPSDPWNNHGDYNKPNLVAPAVGVRTANGLAASGTSAATPIVAGVAAQLLANEPVLAAWPEGARAVLTAGAVHRVRMPDGSVNVDHEGAGMTSALWTARIANTGDGQYGGYRIDALSPGDEPAQYISVRSGDRLRVALAWSSHTSGGNLDKTDTLRADLDLRVTAPNGAVMGSYTIDNAYEWVEFTMPTSGTARIEVLQSRFDGWSERYGLAWAKVRDASAPSVSVRVPAASEPWAVPSTAVRATFSESVSGVGGATFLLRRTSNGNRVTASVSYNASSRTTTLQPKSALSPGRYTASLSGDIRDAAGNGIKPTSWTFTVATPASMPVTTYAQPRSIRFASGTHVGYRFNAKGDVTASRSYTLGQPSGARVDRRAAVRGQPGTWLRVTNGIWAGYWIRESAAAGLEGRTGSWAFTSPRRFVVRAGVHTGRKFDIDGDVIAAKSYNVTRPSGASTSERAVINGAAHLKVVDGIWAGYWLPESSLMYLPGVLRLTDLHDNRAVIAKGTRTGYRYNGDAEVRATRTYTLGAASGAPVAGWAIINGRRAFYVTAGIWAGYWLPESAGVHVP